MSSFQEIESRKIQNRRANIVLITLGLFVAFGILITVLSPYLPASPARSFAPTAIPQPTDIDACVMAHLFVKDRLKSPSTAQFAACREPDTTVSHSANHWTVQSYVDSQNSFGAMLRSDYLTEMRYEPDSEKWTLTGFDFVSR